MVSDQQKASLAVSGQLRNARRIRVRRSITQVGGKLTEGNPKSAAGRRSVPIPERLVPILTAATGATFRRIGNLLPPGFTARVGELETISPMAGVNCRDRSSYAAGTRPSAATEDDGPCIDYGDAHIYADLYDDELDDIASALDRLDDSRSSGA
jgi:hypothetical protein